ncbi:unnamed protein product [Effrenium voratum]|uniref:Uncharacterized protein n=1 Tax=Effrenium voratum TaxID=2562239 RepID=A0AA36JRA0_9DINO|nr:unnamed protein product [Effrenium voratum]
MNVMAPDFSDLAEPGAYCEIPQEEHRAMALPQLRRVVSHAARRCAEEGWTRFGEALEADKVNLYEVTSFVIKPFTEVKRCSYVEMVAFQEQPAATFVSHWWGESCRDFVACVEQHARDHGLLADRAADAGAGNGGAGPEHYYWVCAYANNQWELDNAVTRDPGESSFRRAMDLASGALSVVDAKAVVFSRIWCCYEVFVALDKVDTMRTCTEIVEIDIPGDAFDEMNFDVKPGTTTVPRCNGAEVTSREALAAQVASCGDSVPLVLERSRRYAYSVYTSVPQHTYLPLEEPRAAVGLLNGLAPTDRDVWRKSGRESYFPLDLVKSTLGIQCEDASASKELDRVHILNAICGSEDLDAAVPEAHAKYQELNEVLRGRLLAATWLRLLQEGSVAERGRVTLEEEGAMLARMAPYGLALRSSRLQVLNLNFEMNLVFTHAAAAHLAESLPDTLRVLDLNLLGARCGEGGRLLFAATARMPDLEELISTGEVEGCLAELLPGCPKLREISLREGGCTAETAELFAQAITEKKFPALQVLRFHIAGSCPEPQREVLRRAMLQQEGRLVYLS